MKRDLALSVLKGQVTDDIVVAVYQACFDWLALNPRDLNYLSTGAMGQASSHGLGLALTRPDKRVLVFDGDGSLLMNLGALVTVAEAAPANFYHFVFSNGTYEVNGGHPIPGKALGSLHRIVQQSRSLRDAALKHDMHFLAYLLDLAVREAERLSSLPETNETD